MNKLVKGLLIVSVIALASSAALIGVKVHYYNQKEACQQEAENHGGVVWPYFYGGKNTPPKHSYLTPEELEVKPDFVALKPVEKEKFWQDYYSSMAGAKAKHEDDFLTYSEGSLSVGLGIIGLMFLYFLVVNGTKLIFKGWLHLVRETAKAIRG